ISGREPRQTTSNIGHINKPSIQALIHGLNRHYYSIAVNYRKTELEQSMLMNLHKRNWTEGLKLRDFHLHKQENEKAIKVITYIRRSFIAYSHSCSISLCLHSQRPTTNPCRKSPR